MAERPAPLTAGRDVALSYVALSCVALSDVAPSDVALRDLAPNSPQIPQGGFCTENDRIGVGNRGALHDRGMPDYLPAILSTIDLPLPELIAARLDGELYGVDRCFAAVDEIEQPRHRAAALRSQFSERVIAEQRSAAWIWGALDSPPVHHELCVAIGARVTAPAERWVTVREVVIAANELTTVGDMQVTTRLRTAVDILRFSRHFGADEARIVERLMVGGSFGADDCVAELNARRNLPHKRRAMERIAGLWERGSVSHC